MNKLESVRTTIAAELEEISTMFKPGMKLTFVARMPDCPNMELVITDDDLSEVKATLERSQNRERT